MLCGWRTTSNRPERYGQESGEPLSSKRQDNDWRRLLLAWKQVKVPVCVCARVCAPSRARVATRERRAAQIHWQHTRTRLFATKRAHCRRATRLWARLKREKHQTDKLTFHSLATAATLARLVYSLFR